MVLWVVTGLSSIATGLVPLARDLELYALVALPTFFTQAPGYLWLPVLAVVVLREGRSSPAAGKLGLLHAERLSWGLALVTGK